MTITDDDINYLRNINTSPGPNAGHSIDPTKPGPDADRASPEPQAVRMDANVETVAAVRRAIKEAWLVDGDKTDLDADRLASAAIAALAQSDAEPVRAFADVRKALADLVKWKDYKDEHGADATYELGKERAWRNARAALAQSDAEPKHDVRVTDAMVEAAGEAWLRARLNIRPDGLTEECWSEILSAMRVVLAAALAQSDAEPVRTAPETCPHCFNEEDCGQIELCSALAKGPQSDAEPKGIDLDDADRAYDKWAEHRNGQSRSDAFRLDAFRAGVEFGLRHTAPPRPDVSGLIEAAERCTAKIVPDSIWPADSCTVEDNKITAIIVDALRSRAADRSGK